MKILSTIFLFLFEWFCRIYIAIAVILAVIIAGIILFPALILECLMGER